MMLRDAAIGVLTILIADGIWFAILLWTGRAQWSGRRSLACSVASFLLIWGAPALAAFLCARRAPERKVLAGMSMVIPATVLIVAMHVLYGSSGHRVDFPGIQGGAVVAALPVTWNVVLCALGSGAGYLSAR